MSRVHITSVSFTSYKALGDFSVRLSHLNILVGPNNCGKSTVIGVFRVLALALRKAKAKRAERLMGPDGLGGGWSVASDLLPVSIKNVHTDYENVDTIVEFKTSNRATLTLYFPERGGCSLFATGSNGPIRGPKGIRELEVDVRAVPVLGPLEDEEKVLTAETVRSSLATTRASRHFRNYWRINTDKFEDFRILIRETWPGMDIKPPELIEGSLAMFCSEGRMDRELYWSGFGFQVWCQMLTHLTRSQGASLIVIDEPEVYLHPDIQRQLLGVLRGLGPDILIATHSTEIMSDADPSEILLVDKKKRKAERLRDVDGVQAALRTVGSVQNITLTQLARNRRILFIEGESDFQLIKRFAKKLSLRELAVGADLTPIPSGGFSSWERVRALASGFESMLGVGLHVGAVFDRDYWCEEELAEIERRLKEHLIFAHIHSRKEIENYLLVPMVLQRALERAILERERRTGKPAKNGPSIEQLLEEVTRGLRGECQSRYIAKRVDYFKRGNQDTSTITARAIEVFDEQWRDIETRMQIVPGKTVLRTLRDKVRRAYAVGLGDHAIVTAFERNEFAEDLTALLRGLDGFRRASAELT